MKLAKTRFAILCGVIDGALFTLLVLVVVLLGDISDFQKLFTTHWQYLVFGLLPFGVLTMWRGTRDVKRLLAGNWSFLRVPIEGVVWGFTLSMLFWLVGYVDEVLASGGDF